MQLFTVDAFSSVPFGGNPAAVCLDNSTNGIPESTMQNIAAEMNISETAFVRAEQEGTDFVTGSRFHLRWFTPTNEVPLCGHATLASAAVLFNCMGNSHSEVIFNTLSGPLHAQKVGDCIKLVLPCNTPEPCDVQKVEKLVELLHIGTKPQAVVRSNTAELLVRLPDSFTRTDLEGLNPQVDDFLKFENSGFVKGLIVTVKGSKSNGAVDASGRCYDFMSRYFAPWNGIKEDPVTGAAHTVLAPYWSKELAKTHLYARQCSKRGGELDVTVREDGRLDVLGKATVVLKAELMI